MDIRIKTIGKRFFYLLFVLLGLSIVIFVMARIMPGDPVRMTLGARAPDWVVQKTIEENHLNDPLYKQYYYWFKGILHGNFGFSWVTRRPVIEDIKIFFPASLELIMYTVILIGIFGLLFGAISAWNSNSWMDTIFRIQTYIGISVPPFIFAILFMVIFATVLKVLPSMGRLSQGVVPPPAITHLITIDALLAGDFPVFFDAIKHLIIPVISLSMKPVVEVARLTRASMIENLEKDYITSARSYGIPDRLIMLKYLLKPSIIPTISYFGLCSVQLFANAFIIEDIFNWPGFARYGMIALLNKDLNSIIAVVLVIGLLFIISSIIVDVTNQWLDPRISIREGV
jgi:peptide/nickel transport system permease protein